MHVWFVVTLLLSSTLLAFAQDCPSRAQNEKFVNDFIKDEEKKFDAMTSERREKLQKLSKDIEDNYKKSHVNPDDIICDVTTVVERWDAQLKMKVVDFREMTMTYKEVRAALEVGVPNIFSWRERDTRTSQQKAASENAKQLEKEWADLYKSYYGNDPIGGITENLQRLTIGATLRNSLISIPCGYVIQEIKKSGEKYDVVISKVSGTEGSHTVNESKSRQMLDNFYAEMKKNYERMRNESKALTWNDDKKNQQVQNESGKSTSDPTQIDNEITPDDEKDLSMIQGRHYDIDEDGKTDWVWRKDPDGTERKYEDTNGDGKADAVTIRRPDETATLIVDSDLDGKYDKRVEIATDGSRQTYDITETKEADKNNYKGEVDLSIPEFMTPEELSAKRIAEREIKRHEDLMKQRAPGTYGYIYTITPIKELDKKSQDKFVNYSIFGIGNTAVDSRNKGQLLFNATGEKGYVIYSESAVQTEQLAAGLLDAENALEILKNKFGPSPAADRLSNNMREDLIAGEKVRITVHSRGAAEAYIAVHDAQEKLDQRGLGDLMKNVEVITLGGFSPPAETWRTKAQVVDIVNPGDIVPALMGKGDPGRIPEYVITGSTMYAHPLKSYLPWVEYISKKGIDRYALEQSKTQAPPPKGK